MAQRPMWIIWLSVCGFLLLGWASGCGDPDYCNNDRDCKDGKVCIHQKCSVPTTADAGEEKKTLPDKQPEKPVVKEEPIVVDKVTQPDKPTQPDKQTQTPGIRKEGDVCDPRRLAYAHDRCGPGLGCAEYAQTSPSSGAPQPHGICLKSCSKDDSTCPSGRICIQTLNTKTRQPTGIYVCAHEAGEGSSCVNLDGCKKGLSCHLYGTEGTKWVCQKDCTQDAKACGTGYSCETAESGKPTKLCRKIENQDQYCGDAITCDSDSVCYEGNRFGAFQRYCRKKCTRDADCEKSEVCSPIRIGGVPSGGACLKRVPAGESCHNGRACEKGALCLDLATDYARCFKQCSNTGECASGQSCEAISSRNPTKVCKSTVPPGETPNNLAKCGNGSRGIALSQTDRTQICLASCTGLGGQADQKLCGKLTPGALRAVLALPTGGFLTLGQFGVLGSSSQGKEWIRKPFPVTVDMHSLARSEDGSLILAVGAKGTILRSEDKGQTFVPVTSGVTSDLLAVAIEQDGASAIAVGAKGVILRSLDLGKTWTSITIQPTAVTEDLLGVAVGMDVGNNAKKAIYMAVGRKGTALLSEDRGKTWTVMTGVGTEALHDVAIKRDPDATGLSAVIVGAKGSIWTSTDKGKIWKQETSGVTTALHAVALHQKKVVVVGDSGTVLVLQEAKWVKSTTPNTLHLYDVIIEGSSWIAVSFLGASILTSDEGKSWQATQTSQGRCVGLRSGGGVCLVLCNPINKGSDCPSTSSRCGSINLGGGAVNICFPGTSSPGTAKTGEPCARYAGANPSKRCGPNHACAFTGSGFFCLRRCTKGGALGCTAPDTCIFSPTTRSTFCGKAVDGGQTCDLGKGIFCKEGHTCVRDPFTNVSSCRPVPVAKEFETCDNRHRPCAEGLICSGLGSTPYRLFCTRQCNPRGGAASGCATGFDCLATSANSGICVERCSSPNHKCKVKHVRCLRVTQSNNLHCI